MKSLRATFRLRSLILAAPLALAACHSSPQPPAGSPPGKGDATSTAKAFYQALRQEPIRGLPDAKQMKRIAPYLTEGLVSAFGKAAKEQKAYMAKFPEDKPPWIEGDLFGSLFEGPTSWTAGPASVKGRKAEAPVRLVYRDTEKPVEWTDTIVFEQGADGAWKVQDIRMGGKWAFKAGGDSLLQTLTSEP